MRRNPTPEKKKPVIKTAAIAAVVRGDAFEVLDGAKTDAIPKSREEALSNMHQLSGLTAEQRARQPDWYAQLTKAMCSFIAADQRIDPKGVVIAKAIG